MLSLLRSCTLGRTEAPGWEIVAGQCDDGLTTFYDVHLGASPGHIQHKGLCVLE